LPVGCRDRSVRRAGLLSLWGRRAVLLAVPASITPEVALVAHRGCFRPARRRHCRRTESTAAESATERPNRCEDKALLSRPELRPRALALGVRRVVIDAGHGGEHPGASSASGLREKDVTLDLAERARRLLVDQRLDVVLTRTGDDTLWLKQRSATANQQRGDIFVSIHLNSFAAGSTRGIRNLLPRTRRAAGT